MNSRRILLEICIFLVDSVPFTSSYLFAFNLFALRSISLKEFSNKRKWKNSIASFSSLLKIYERKVFISPGRLFFFCMKVPLHCWQYYFKTFHSTSTRAAFNMLSDVLDSLQVELKEWTDERDVSPEDIINITIKLVPMTFLPSHHDA